jgi:hypothetical protein
MSKMNILEADRPKVKVECLRLLVNLQLDPARTYLISGFVDTDLRLNQAEEQVFQTEIAKIITTTEQEQVMELTTSWMERGIERGLEQERRSAISGLLELRYGSIDEQLSAIVQPHNQYPEHGWNRYWLLPSQMVHQKLVSNHFQMLLILQ